MRLVVTPLGEVRCIYDEMLDFHALGEVRIERASHVEPTPCGRWEADLRPVSGPVLGPFAHRSQALEAERQWLEDHWLTGGSRQPSASATRS